MEKPDIIYFLGDQMRCDALHHMGCEASVTPNFDSMLEDAVSYKNAYCQNPVCVPSRCSFMTGLYPHTTGHRTMHYLQNQDESNILKVMKDNGYEVVWVGRNDLIPADRSKEGYCDYFFDGISKENRSAYSSDTKPVKYPKQDCQTSLEKGMKEIGYYSHFIGKISGEEAHKAREVSNDWIAIESALDYLEERGKKADRKPLFMYITLTYPHPPYMCEDPWYSQISRELCTVRRPNAGQLCKPKMLQKIAEKQNLKDWGDDNFIEMRAVYLAMVSRLDYQFGLLKDKLKSTGCYDQAAIFIFSDHGDYTGDYDVAEKIQNCFEDCIVNVPLIVKPPKSYQIEPRISEALVELVDLTATVEELTGIMTDYVHFGKSLIHTFIGEEQHKDAVFSEGGRLRGEYWAMERGHNKDSVYWPRLSTQCSENGEHTKAVMIRMGKLKYVYRLYEKDELYDLETDPKECVNLIGDESYRSAVTMMKLRMLDWFVETGDIVPDRKDPRR